ncbi:MAG: PAS domain-containing protein [Candidatus Omnitrophica bacterium]|nr:PAS domain-containing protein [Candidatus Omnitrophota bacterium]
MEPHTIPGYDLRAVIDLLPDYIFFKDDRGRYTDANKATLRIMRCQSLEDCIGKTDFDFYPEKFALKYYADDCEIFRTGEPKLDMEEIAPNEYGELGYYSTSKIPLKDSDGKVYGLVGICRNITDRKKAQELASQREIDKANRLSDLGTLVTSVAHELRNPLEVIKLSAIRLEKDNPSGKAKLLDHIHKKLWESEKIIDNLLNYSRIKIPQYERCDLIALIEECTGVLPAGSQAAEIVVDKNYPAGEVFLDADPYQMKQVFSNIFNNACQAVAGKKGRVEISILRKDGNVHVDFKDNGTGIDAKNLDKIFTPFYTSKATGTGLGLAICKELINLHHGKIEVQSKKGEGTLFRISLPLQR